MIKYFDIKTQRQAMHNITDKVEKYLLESGVTEGICVVYCPHTTAGIAINENADPDVQHDLLLGWDGAFSDSTEFMHLEGNSSAHLKASSVGTSQTVIISEGQLLLGRWQGIYFCEFDGPRNRQCLLKFISC